MAMSDKATVIWNDTPWNGETQWPTNITPNPDNGGRTMLFDMPPAPPDGFRWRLDFVTDFWILEPDTSDDEVGSK